MATNVGTDLVAQALRGDNRDLIAETLVGLEVERQLGVVTLDHNLGGPLDGLHIVSFFSPTIIL